MSGDVQPRKRKDKKRKKDELGVEEPRGTAAVLGEGDVFMHSQHEHGTGGHWCAKIIFFSLLAVLVTLIGLIILENRGLSELEANSVESRYSGVLEGWLEDAPDDDHHDEHTLELKHHEEDEHEEAEEEDSAEEVEVEKLEKEVTDQDVIDDVFDEPPAPEIEDDDDKSQEESTELAPEDDDDSVEDEEFLEADDIDEEDMPVIEHIVAPQGKPLDEVEDEPTTAKPVNTLDEEEEYEKQQEDLRREQEQASHMWLKLAVGGALLVATHAVVRRALTPRDDTPASEEHASREDTPSLIDRRMTLIAAQSLPAATPQVTKENVQSVVKEEIFDKVASVIKFAPPPKEESEEEELEEEEEEIVETKDIQAEEPKISAEPEDKELYSDEEEVEEEAEDEVEEVVEEPSKQSPAVAERNIEPEPEADEEVPDDVEIIDEDQLEEELGEEEMGDEEDEEEISDVDDAELLSRLEAKYGRLPEPERPQPKHKDGGDSIEDDWPGEPADKYWRQQLDQAEQELRQEYLD